MFDRVLNSSLTNIQSSFIHFKYQKNLELKYGKGRRERKNFSNSILTQLTLRFMELWVCSVYYENRLGSFVSRLNIVFFFQNFGSKIRFWILLRIQIWNFISEFLVESRSSFRTSQSNKNPETKPGSRVQIVSRKCSFELEFE